jgi:hypothetical protein
MAFAGFRDYAQPVTFPSSQLLGGGWRLCESLKRSVSPSPGQNCFYPINLRTARNLSLGIYDTCRRLISSFSFPPSSLFLPTDVFQA